ncbi:MAG: hypothetical protein WBF48_10735 [Halarcobacter sp.]
MHLSKTYEFEKKELNKILEILGKSNYALVKEKMGKVKAIDDEDHTYYQITYSLYESPTIQDKLIKYINSKLAFYEDECLKINNDFIQKICFKMSPLENILKMEKELSSLSTFLNLEKPNFSDLKSYIKSEFKKSSMNIDDICINEIIQNYRNNYNFQYSDFMFHQFLYKLKQSATFNENKITVAKVKSQY